MSAISLKSITGITSITTPSGVDNVFTVHTNDTTERFRVDQTGNLNIAGIVTVTKDLDVDGHTNLDNVNIVGVATVTGNIDVVTTGTNVGIAVTQNGTGNILNLYDGSNLRFAVNQYGNPTVTSGNPVYASTNSSSSVTTTLFSNSAGQGVLQTNSGHSLILGTGAVEKLRITGNGHVNIGGDYAQTTYKFKVTGTSYFDGHTNLDNVSIAGVSTVNTFLQVFGVAGTSDKGFEVRSNSTQNTDTNKAIRIRNNSNTDTFNISYRGKVTATSFVGSGANLTNLPIGGSNAISLNDNVNLNIGTDNDASLFNSGSYLFLKNHNGNVAIQASGTGSVISLQKYNNSDIGLQYIVDGAVKLYHDNSPKFETIGAGVSVTNGHLEQQYGGISSKVGYVSGGAEAYFGSTSNHSLVLGTNDVEKLRINTNGQVTIGNNYGQTQRKLYVETTHTSGGEVVYFGNSDSGNYGGLVLSAGENNGECRFNSAWGNSYFTFYTQDAGGAAERLKISSNGTIWQALGTKYAQRGYFRSDTNNQNASNAASLAGSLGYGFGYQEAYSTSGGTWVHPYPDLVLGYHTGISMGAYPNYGGIRFFTDHPSSSSTMIMSIGNGSNGVVVTNSLSKGGGSFRIAHPHPSKKYTHDLVHSFIEGPQMDLIYRGKIDLVGGSATVNIDTKANMTDGTFVLLNRDVQCFTSNETGWTAVKGSVSGNILTITAQDNSCTDTISWMVVGERQDDKIKSLDMTDDNGDLITEPLTIEETHM